VLAQQHLNTFRERMAGYPVAVEMVSRFRSRKEQTQILAALAAGRIDILIGTHRLVQADVQFKDLGLVIIDEEQRFGVKHKEVFKRWRAHVDMLSMSATPIPRTLELTVYGDLDVSRIDEKPPGRTPVAAAGRRNGPPRPLPAPGAGHPRHPAGASPAAAPPLPGCACRRGWRGCPPGA
jgi:transcription-repair coupling factor (superfamily II helicase)